MKTIPRGMPTKFIYCDGKSNLPKIYYPDYRDARRKAFCIYKVLVTELYEACCPIAAKYFEYFIEKEVAILQAKISLHSLKEEPKFLLALQDKCKMAEISYRMNKTNGKVTCCEMLLQCMFLCDQYVDKYQWLRDEVYPLVGNICSKIMKNSTQSKECLSVIYYRNGLLLQKTTGRDLMECLSYFEKGFRLAFEENWILTHPTSGDQSKLVVAIAKALAYNLLKHAAFMTKQNTRLAINLTEKALYVLTVLDKNDYYLTIINAYLDLVTYLIADDNVEKALTTLLHFKSELFTPSYNVQNFDFLQAKCRYIHLTANCKELLGNETEALIHFIEAVQISRSLQDKESEAMNLMHISWIYIGKGHSQFNLAIKAISEAKELYYYLGDRPNFKKCSYLLAKLNFTRVFPLLCDKIRGEATNYCDRFHLYNWKTRIAPFWYNMAMTSEKEILDPIHCLLNECNKRPKPGAKIAYKRPPPRKYIGLYSADSQARP